MQPYSTPSLVRADQRYNCSLGAVLRPAVAEASMPGGEPSDQVLLGRSAGEGDGTVKATVVDLSRGGLGVCTPIFFPRGARIEISVTAKDGIGTVVGRVQRVEMRDRKPTYYIGVSMASPSDAAPVLESLMSELRRASAEVSR
jgi:hypothetical protein